MKKLLTIAAIAGFAFAGNFNCGMCHNGGMAAKLDKMTPAEIVKKAKENKNPMMQNAIKGMSDADLMKAAKEFGKK
jgi:heterodisulfide reductase subunit C